MNERVQSHSCCDESEESVATGVTRSSSYSLRPGPATRPGYVKHPTSKPYVVELLMKSRSGYKVSSSVP